MGAFVETRTVVSMEVPRLRTRPPVEADGCFLWRHLSPQRTTRGCKNGRFAQRDEGGRDDAGNDLGHGGLRGQYRCGAVCAPAAPGLRHGEAIEPGASSCPLVPRAAMYVGAECQHTSERYGADDYFLSKSGVPMDTHGTPESFMPPQPGKHVCPRCGGLLLTQHYIDRKSTRLNSSHLKLSRMPSSA